VVEPDETKRTSPDAGDTEVVAVIASGPALARAALDAWDAGAAILAVNPHLPSLELRRLLAQLRPSVVVEGRERTRNPDGVRAADGIAAIVVTSGTTGTPKGVELTRAGMEVMGRGYSDGLDATESDRWLACLPLHHVASLAVLARSHVTGVPCTVHDRFDVERVARSPRDEGTTIVSLVPTTLLRLLDAGAPVHEFRRVVVGGAPCPPALRARAEDAGVTVVDAYGLSETWGGFALDGVPIAGAEVRLDSSTGEILVRGAMVMRGYRLDPRRSAEVLDGDGMLHTGDVGRFDDAQRIRVVDRIKDLVITGGVNVSPTEVESVLAEHPDVADVCVVGIPDPEWGERVVAFVVPGSRAPTLEDLRQFARTLLATPKLPREVRIVDAIPRSQSGKPLRRELRDDA
jgi:O-succinylbenzoic acid--CoA ligase